MNDVADAVVVKKLGTRRNLVILAVCSVVVLLVAQFGLSWRDDHQSIGTQLTTYHDIRIGMARQEVRYVLGEPDHVLGKEYFDRKFGGALAPVYQVDGKDSINKLLPNTTIDNYPAWQFTGDNQYWQIDYDKADRVTEITCWTDTRVGAGDCEPLLGVEKNATEEEVIARLGKPSSEKFVDAAKLATWDGLGIKVAFMKRRAFQITKTPPRWSAWQAFRALRLPF